MKKDEFQCAMCGNIYKKGRTDEEAHQECVENFGKDLAYNDDIVDVCDDCYELIKPSLYPEKIISAKLEFEIRGAVKKYAEGIQDTDKYIEKLSDEIN